MEFVVRINVSKIAKFVYFVLSFASIVISTGLLIDEEMSAASSKPAVTQPAVALSSESSEVLSDEPVKQICQLFWI